MHKISKEFEDIFQDIEMVRSDLKLFYEPMTCSIEDQHVRCQIELAEMQNDHYFIRYKDNMHEEFWKLITPTNFLNLFDFGLKMLFMFGST